MVFLVPKFPLGSSLCQFRHRNSHTNALKPMVRTEFTRSTSPVSCGIITIRSTFMNSHLIARAYGSGRQKMPMPLTISCRNAELSASADIDSLEDDADASLDRARQRWVEICQEAVLQRDTSMGMLSEEINRLLSRDDSRT